MATKNLWGSVVFIFSLILLSITTLYNETIQQIDRVETHQYWVMKMSSKSRSSSGWYHVIEQKMKRKRMKIGVILGANASLDINLGEDVEVVNIPFELISMDVEWKNLYPDWIDENRPWDSLKCPHIPMPKTDDYYNELDAVVANVPCPKTKGRIRDHSDVLRLQVNLVVANLLTKSGRKDNGGVFAVFSGSESCRPMLEIFRCDDLLFHEGNTFVYKPDLSKLTQKIHMPVGSCQLAPFFSETGQEEVKNGAIHKVKEAYVTVLHSSEDYVCGAIVLAQSIIMSNTTRELILLADDSISANHLHGPKAAGWKIKLIKRIRNPYADTNKESYNEWNYSKLRIWQLIEFHKLIFIDSDFILLRNIDEFFAYPELSAVANSRHIFNSGLMLVEPSSCMFRTLKRRTFQVKSYNGGDQGFLNEVFMWWHRWPSKLNFLKDFKPLPDSMHEVIPEDVYAMHYLGFKPWMCRRSDYDCNRDVSENRRFTSDSAHKLWWQIYQTMPENLRSHCVLTPEMEERKKLHIAKPA